ncbi:MULTISPECIES: hypothetical protein [Rhizobium/Agrobacterium group]|uniref:Uncharacterized protein n=1 Tax=Neorhizobium petrolearium TaxID=515361 RepID=A0ABY8M3W8_9HYPH|nr:MULTISPECIES: hypothetical protein [Rhizobium/Agrobacterium group]MCC2608918.1 hypothetical protein [Neorhizobium petrolearium]WGI69164.1 hypothetical protein QEO92_03480 [Neorhizobium petrolearium]
MLEIDAALVKRLVSAQFPHRDRRSARKGYACADTRRRWSERIVAAHLVMA